MGLCDAVPISSAERSQILLSGSVPVGSVNKVKLILRMRQENAMLLTQAQAEVMRSNALTLLNQVLPYKTGEADYKVVCRDYGGHPGTTCGFLPHWLMWRLGVTSANMSSIPSANGGAARSTTTVNRKETGFQYKNGENITCIRYNSNFVLTAVPNATALTTGRRPIIGDPCYITQTDPMLANSDHVFCFVMENNGKWITAESGQEYGEWGKFRDDRSLRLGTTPKVTGNTPNRTLIGWLPLDKLDYGPAPLPLPIPFIS